MFEGNPLHSTALEEGLSPRAEQNQRSAPGKTGRQQVSGKTRTTNKSKSVSKALEKITASKENQEPFESRKPGAAATVRYSERFSEIDMGFIGVDAMILSLLFNTLFQKS